MPDEAQPFSDKDYDEFWLAKLFPEPSTLFAVHQKPLSEIKTTSLVALDANVLLLPYELGSSSFDKIADVYRNLAKEKRLVVPAQAAREFIKNRASKLRDLVKQIYDQASSLDVSAYERISFLADEKSFKNIKKHASTISEARKKLLSEIASLREMLVANVGADPVSAVYREVFNGTVGEPKYNEKALAMLKEEAEWRYRHNIPPGYKDRNKPDGGLGDFIIWKSLLDAGASQKRDVIFVTKEVKGDWWVQAQGAFQPRIELVEEFYRATEGKTIQIIPLSQLLEVFDVPKEAVTDVRRAEESASDRNFQQGILEALTTVSATVTGLEDWRVSQLLREKKRLESHVRELWRQSQPYRNSLEAPESVPDDELTNLLRQERALRNERSQLRRRISLIDRELSRRGNQALSESEE
jgi:hypothetical protein